MAGGRVRCNDCDIEFKASEHLSEEEQIEKESTGNRQSGEELLQANPTLEAFASAMNQGQNISEFLDTDSSMVETIVMEGEMVRNTLQEEQRKSDEADCEVKVPAWMKDTYSRNRGTICEPRAIDSPPSDSPGNRGGYGYAVIASLALMCLFLFWQIIH